MTAAIAESLRRLVFLILPMRRFALLTPAASGRHTTHAKRRVRALDDPTRRRFALSFPTHTPPSFLGPELTRCRSYNTAPEPTQRHDQPNAAGPHAHAKGTPGTSRHTVESPAHTRINRGDLSVPPALPSRTLLYFLDPALYPMTPGSLPLIS
jgi:hypothetical protein